MQRWADIRTTLGQRIMFSGGSSILAQWLDFWKCIVVREIVTARLIAYLLHSASQQTRDIYPMLF